MRRWTGSKEPWTAGWTPASASSSSKAELQRIGLDRSRLAQTVDAAEARSGRLEEANKEVSRRLVAAMETIRAVLDRQRR